jgi:hypothetical protein
MPVKVYPAYATMSNKGASPLPNERSIILSNATCINQPSNPLTNSQLRASGLNLGKKKPKLESSDEINFQSKDKKGCWNSMLAGLNNASCPNQSRNPLSNSQLIASGLNLESNGIKLDLR